MQTYTFYVTEGALQVLKTFLTRRNLPKVLRISIKGESLSGIFKYSIECAEYVSDTGDVYFHCGDDISIVIDKKSIRGLNGAVLRWVEGHMESGLKITNPNEKLTHKYKHTN